MEGLSASCFFLLFLLSLGKKSKEGLLPWGNAKGSFYGIPLSLKLHAWFGMCTFLCDVSNSFPPAAFIYFSPPLRMRASVPATRDPLSLDTGCQSKRGLLCSLAFLSSSLPLNQRDSRKEARSSMGGFWKEAKEEGKREGEGRVRSKCQLGVGLICSGRGHFRRRSPMELDITFLSISDPFAS